MDSAASCARGILTLQGVAQRPVKPEKAYGIQEELRRLIPNADSTRSQQALPSACR